MAIQRDMSYDLDSIFSTRNQGQLISSKPVQTKMTRVPGLKQISGDMMPGMGDLSTLSINWPTLLVGGALVFIVLKAMSNKGPAFTRI